MTLRDALNEALTRVETDEARMLILALLDQRVDNEHETLVEECEFVIFG